MVDVIERPLTIAGTKVMSAEDGLSILGWSQKTNYVPGTYLFASAPIPADASEAGIGAAADVLEQHVGLVRVLWGSRIAWALVQRSMVEVATGEMADLTPTFPIPHSQSAIWADDFDRSSLIHALTEGKDKERLWRSLHLVSRATDVDEMSRPLWFWAAMEVLCDCETEATITQKFASVYGESAARKQIGITFGLRNAARARHEIAHRGEAKAKGSLVTEYYIALYVDLLSGLYLGKCVRRAERMIKDGFDPANLKPDATDLNVLHIRVS